MSLGFTSFRTRLLTFVIGLLVLVQGAALLLVHAANLREARRHVDEALELTAAALRRSLQVRERILVEKTHLLSSDFAFKEVTATGDRATILSALSNHSARVGADVMMLLETSGEVVADTRHPRGGANAAEVQLLVALARDSEFGEASAVLLLDEQPHQLVIVPLFTPEPSAWIVMGFAIDDALAGELREETGTQVSLLGPAAIGWRTFSSTLGSSDRGALEEALARQTSGASPLQTMALPGDTYATWIAPLDDSGVQLLAVLQRSLDDALAPFLQLRTMLYLIFAGGLALSVLGGLLLARRVTQPVEALARGAERIEHGDYTATVTVEQRDELGALAHSFNAMTKGLAERDQVRDLLGRVVAPEIADELLRHEIELGGEVRTVSILFADLRGFTTLSEREEPQRLVRVLNIFLTAASHAIEAHGGVVEEYMGDGAKALFGAPLSHPDDAQRAVRAALALCEALPEVNERVAELGVAPLDLGIGVHTDDVVAGRMGSLSRLKYTVIGDGVNLASRLEGLTRPYGVRIIVSDATRRRCDAILFRELDQTRVKGRRQAVAIHEPVGLADAVSAALREEVDRHHEALARFRARDWEGARAAFLALREQSAVPALYDFYLARIARLVEDPPGPEWDGVYVSESK